MNILKVSSILFFLILLSVALQFNGCKSDPFIIEVPGEPNPIDNGTIISVVETELCNNGVISFQYEILPILVSGCAYDGCHSTASHEDGVIMDNYTEVMKEVTSGDINDSELYETITENPNNDDFMPPAPADGLTSAQINIIKTWIEQGANNTDCKAPCNSEEASFSVNVFPLIQDQCYGCHQPNNAQGGINLEDYDHIRTFAGNGNLLGSVKHTLGYEAMPTAGNKLTDCQIATINNWIVEGALSDNFKVSDS
jgi:uncharacterized membrane protein